MTFALFIVPVTLLLLGFPIFMVLLTAVAVALVFFMHVPLVVLHQNLFGSVNATPLLAVPFFIYAGELMGRGSVAQRLVDFVQGGTDLGNTQYIDAYQRGNFWGANVQVNTNYHVLLGSPTVLAEQQINVSRSQGKVMRNPFGSSNVGTMNINSFDAKLQTIIANNSGTINPGVLPIFLTDNIFLTQGGCCIGGYHSSNGSQPAGQTYAYASYVTDVGSFSQDVSALSHEIGEWMDDPFVDNAVNCTDNSIMENGDPLEGRANYGGYPYSLNNFTYNLQSLVFIGYFGAPRSTSVHSWLSFQNDEASVCPGQ